MEVLDALFSLVNTTANQAPSVSEVVDVETPIDSKLSDVGAAPAAAADAAGGVDASGSLLESAVPWTESSAAMFDTDRGVSVMGTGRSLTSKVDRQSTQEVWDPMM